MLCTIVMEEECLDSLRDELSNIEDYANKMTMRAARQLERRELVQTRFNGKEEGA